MNKKKLLALLMALVMVLTLAPVTAVAEVSEAIGGGESGPYVARNDDFNYPTLDEAFAAAADGDTITLLADVELSSAIEITDGKNVIIDLNGKNILDKDIWVKDGSLEITGTGTIGEWILTNGKAFPQNTADQTITIGSDVTVGGAIQVYGHDENTTKKTTINVNGTVESGILIFGYNYSANGAKCYGLEINVGNTGYVKDHIWVNGNITATDATINVAGKVENEDGHGIALQNGMTVNVKNGARITGKTGIEVRGGTLTVEDGAIIEGTEVPTEAQLNNNGTTTTGAGIAVASYGMSAANVTITGGTIKGYTPFYESNPNGVNLSVYPVSISISGGSFENTNGGTVAAYSGDNTGFISGGYFSSDPAAELIKEGYEAVDNDDPTYKYKVQAVTSDTMYPVDVLGFNEQDKNVSYYLYALSASEFGVGSTDDFTGTKIPFANLSDVQRRIVEACYEFEGQNINNITESKFTFRVPTTEGYTIDTAVTANGGELQSVINSANDNGVITLEQDYVLSTPLTIPADKTLTLDLNGRSITVTDSFKGFMLKNSGTLTLKDSGTNGKIDLSNARIGTYGEAWGVIENSGMMTIKSGHITGKTFTAPKSLGIQNLENATLVIDGGTFDGNTRALNNWGTATVNNGTFDSKASPSTNWYMYTAGNIGANGNLTVNNATITGSHGALFVANGSLVVNGGNFTGGSYYGIYCAGEYGKIQAEINGGTFRSEALYAGLIGNDNDGGIKEEASVVVNGGTFIPAANSMNAVNVAAATGKPIIYGGTFAGKIANLTEKYIGTGYTAVLLENNDPNKVANYTTYRVGEVQTTSNDTISATDITNNTFTYTVSTSIVDSQNNEEIKSLGDNPGITVSGTAENTYSDVVTKSGTSAVGAAALSQLKDAETIGKIVAAAVSSAGSEAENASDISVVLVSDGGTQTKGDAQAPEKVTKITYEVHPEAIVYKTENATNTVIGSYAIKNEELKGTAFSFELDVSALGLEDYAEVYVTHKHANGTSEILGPYTVMNGSITVQGVTSFSEFEVTDANNGVLSFSGASLRRRVKTIDMRTVIKSSTDFRTTFAWALPSGATVDSGNSYFQWSKDGTNWGNTHIPMSNTYDNGASLVITNVPSSAYDTTIYAKLHLEYTMGVNHYSLELVGPARTVKGMAESLSARTDIEAKWRDYAKFLLDEYESYTITDTDPYYYVDGITQ